MKSVINELDASENLNEQFTLVNQLEKILKSDKKFSSKFNSIELEIARPQQIGEYSVQYYKIVCK